MKQGSQESGDREALFLPSWFPYKCFLIHNPTSSPTVSAVSVETLSGPCRFTSWEMISRATLFELLPGLALRTCSAEDLIILKSFASRPQDWIDVENVIVRQRVLDWDYILPRITMLAELKEEPEIVDRLIALRDIP